MCVALHGCSMLAPPVEAKADLPASGRDPVHGAALAPWNSRPGGAIPLGLDPFSQSRLEWGRGCKRTIDDYL
jgi:hypothetical protein